MGIDVFVGIILWRRESGAWLPLGGMKEDRMWNHISILSFWSMLDCILPCLKLNKNQLGGILHLIAVNCRDALPLISSTFGQELKQQGRICQNANMRHCVT